MTFPCVKHVFKTKIYVFPWGASYGKESCPSPLTIEGSNVDTCLTSTANTGSVNAAAADVAVAHISYKCTTLQGMLVTDSVKHLRNGLFLHFFRKETYCRHTVIKMSTFARNTTCCLTFVIVFQRVYNSSSYLSHHLCLSVTQSWWF